MDPIKDPKTAFIFHSRRKPFSISEGLLFDVRCCDEGIVAEFQVTNNGPGYDLENDRVYIQIIDANNKPVMEGWVPMENKEKREGRLWLKEKS